MRPATPCVYRSMHRGLRVAVTGIIVGRLVLVPFPFFFLAFVFLLFYLLFIVSPLVLLLLLEGRTAARVRFLVGRRRVRVEKIGWWWC